MSHDAGKGDTYRRVDQAKYGENYDRIFRRGLEPRLDEPQETNDQAPVKQAAEVPAIDGIRCPGCNRPVFHKFCPGEAAGQTRDHDKAARDE